MLRLLCVKLTAEESQCSSPGYGEAHQEKNVALGERFVFKMLNIFNSEISVKKAPLENEMRT